MKGVLKRVGVLAVIAAFGCLAWATSSSATPAAPAQAGAGKPAGGAPPAVAADVADRAVPAAAPAAGAAADDAAALGARSPAAARAAPRAEVTVKSLLEDAGLEYTTKPTASGETQYRFSIEASGVRTVFVARELTVATRKDGRKVRVMYLYSTIVLFPKNYIPPNLLLKLMADRNNEMAFGNLGMGKTGVFYNNTIWLNNADADTLMDALVLAHHMTQPLCKEFQAIVPKE